MPHQHMQGPEHSIPALAPSPLPSPPPPPPFPSKSLRLSPSPSVRTAYHSYSFATLVLCSLSVPKGTFSGQEDGGVLTRVSGHLSSGGLSLSSNVRHSMDAGTAFVRRNTVLDEAGLVEAAQDEVRGCGQQNKSAHMHPCTLSGYCIRYTRGLHMTTALAVAVKGSRRALAGQVRFAHTVVLGQRRRCRLRSRVRVHPPCARSRPGARTDGSPPAKVALALQYPAGAAQAAAAHQGARGAGQEDTGGRGVGSVCNLPSGAFFSDTSVAGSWALDKKVHEGWVRSRHTTSSAVGRVPR